MTMIDMGCGLGGASRAMRERGWRVIRLDNHADVTPDVVGDMRSPPFRKFHVDLLWVSTSCAQFTIQRLPFGRAVRARKPIDLSCELAVKSFIDYLSPTFFVVENVYASRKWLSPIFGPVRWLSGSHCLWGKLPGLLPQCHYHQKTLCSHKGGDRSRHLMRSVIPYELSLALAIAAERRVSE